MALSRKIAVATVLSLVAASTLLFRLVSHHWPTPAGFAIMLGPALGITLAALARRAT